jgi:hypothetical protein
MTRRSPPLVRRSVPHQAPLGNPKSLKGGVGEGKGGGVGVGTGGGVGVGTGAAGGVLEHAANKIETRAIAAKSFVRWFEAAVLSIAS